MKTFALTISLAVGMTSGLLAASQTLHLKLQPERDCLLSGSPQEVVIKFDLSAAAGLNTHTRTPLNLALVIDRSGSMTGAKMEKARQAAIQLVDQLGSSDRLAVITYNERAEVLVPSQVLEDRKTIKTRLSRISPGGSTALYAGVVTGSEELEKALSNQRINRVILLSDGLANVGPSSKSELRQLGRRLSTRGISVTTIGLGDDYNEDLMAGLAESSDANYYYVKDTETLPQIFARELGGLLSVAAREVRIEIVCPEGIKPIGIIGRPETFMGQRAQIHLSQLAASQNRFVLFRCRVENDAPELAIARVSYRDELNQGIERNIEGSALVRFTNDRELAEKSVQHEVVAQKELLLAAVAKDEALAEADAGQLKAAAVRLNNQAQVLEQQYLNAPDSLRPQIRQEVENLKTRSAEFQQNQYDSSTRKSLQSESWTYRNSKN